MLPHWLRFMHDELHLWPFHFQTRIQFLFRPNGEGMLEMFFIFFLSWISVMAGSAVAASFFGECDNTFVYELVWHYEWNRVTPNKNGATGWATVLRTTSTEVPAGEVIRIHLCKHQPCRARHDSSKYGLYSPPSHFQPRECMPSAPEATSAEPSGVLAVASSSSSEPSSAIELAVAEPPASAVAEPPATIEAHAEVHAEVSTAAAVAEPPASAVAEPPASAMAEPHGVALRNVCAAEPCCMASTYAFAVQSATLARAEGSNDVLGILLCLARSIRTPRTYVGYSFFLLLALAKECRPVMWEGESRVDLLEAYAPWALARCHTGCAVDGVCCCLKATESGYTQLRPVSEEASLSECSHFVACIPADGMDVDSEGTSIQSFYGRLGRVILGTVMDGDCGIDVACMMLGIPQTVQARRQLREDCKQFMIYSRFVSRVTKWVCLGVLCGFRRRFCRCIMHVV